MAAKRAVSASPVDHGYAWVVMLASSCSFVLFAAFSYSIGLINVVLLEKYGNTVAETAVVGSVFWLCMCFVGMCTIYVSMCLCI
jgi:hypothetical protein